MWPGSLLLRDVVSGADFVNHRWYTTTPSPKPSPPPPPAPHSRRRYCCCCCCAAAAIVLRLRLVSSAFVSENRHNYLVLDPLGGLARHILPLLSPSHPVIAEKKISCWGKEPSRSSLPSLLSLLNSRIYTVSIGFDCSVGGGSSVEDRTAIRIKTGSICPNSSVGGGSTVEDRAVDRITNGKYLPQHKCIGG